MVFGTAIWGQDAQLATLFTKVCTNTQSFTWDTTSKNYSKVADIGSLVVSHDLTSQTLAQDEWFFVFVSDTKAGEERDFASWTLGTVTDATFTCQAAAGTSWSEA